MDRRSVTEPLPVPRALDEGATHVLALLNRTAAHLRRHDPRAAQARWARTLDRLTPGLGAMAQQSHRLGPVLAVLDDPAHTTRAGRHLLAVAPGQDAGVRGLTTDRARVELASQLGYAAMHARLAQAVDGRAAV